MGGLLALMEAEVMMILLVTMLIMATDLHEHVDSIFMARLRCLWRFSVHILGHSSATQLFPPLVWVCVGDDTVDTHARLQNVRGRGCGWRGCVSMAVVNIFSHEPNLPCLDLVCIHQPLSNSCS